MRSTGTAVKGVFFLYPVLFCRLSVKLESNNHCVCLFFSSGCLSDPVFFMHHAYIDKIYVDWQAAHQTQSGLEGGGNEFSGIHGNSTSDGTTKMRPWGRRADEILAGISNCVQYVGDGRSANSGTVRQLNEGSDTGGYPLISVTSRDSGDFPKITKEEKKSLLLKVARKKSFGCFKL